MSSSCAEKEFLLKELSRRALEVSDIAVILSKEKGLLPKDRYVSLLEKLEASWKGCEKARKAFRSHQSGHGC
jgi:hypothetical protein